VTQVSLRATRGRALGVVLLALAGLVPLVLHRPATSAGAELDGATVAAAAWAAWVAAAYLLLAVAVAGAGALRGAGRVLRLPGAGAISTSVERWVGVTAAALATAAVSTATVPAMAAGPGPAPSPPVTVTLPGLDWTDAVPATAARLRTAVRVESGDCLWSLAAAELGAAATPREIAGRWPQWWRTNRALIGADPNLIHPGQRLTPPASPPWRS
jgi:nucleoid-associated protein YgaU